jgi:hypothetical protein
MSKSTVFGLQIVLAFAVIALGVRFYLNWKDGRAVIS